MITKRIRLLLALLMSLLMLASSTATAEVPSEEAVRCGCIKGFGGADPRRLLPHYIELGTGTCLNSPVVPDDGVDGYVRFSWVAGFDYFGDHDWHDSNFIVKLDPNAEGLNSNANYLNNNPFLTYDPSIPTLSTLNERLMEVEWDGSHVDPRFRATAGDRVWMTGRYIWDCGHAEKTVYAGISTPEMGYHTEFHPPKAVAFTRLEPHIFKDGEPISLTNKSYIYIHGRSGIKYLGLDYLNSPVAKEDYHFKLPIPPRPAGYPANQIPISTVLALPFGGPNPELKVVQVSPAHNDKFVVDVTYPLAQLNDSNPNRKFGAIVVSGWPPPSPGVPVPGVSFRRLRVVVENVVIRKRHTPFCLADWTLWLNVNGQWRKVDGTTGVNSGTSIPLGQNGVFDVILPETPDARLTIQATGWVAIFDQAFGVGGGKADVAAKFPQLFSLMTTNEGHIGIFFRQFGLGTGGVNAYGIGTDTTRSPDDGELSIQDQEIDANLTNEKGRPDTDSDFGLKYKIIELH